MMPVKPQKTVFLVDMNAFFISCEMVRNPSLRGRPAAVAGDPKKRSGIILAANYDARGYGVKTTMVLHEAQKLCPGLILVPPEIKYYSKMSKSVMEILGSYTPVLEQNSIDEAWLDLTGSPKMSSGCLAVAKEIMDRIGSELGLWCSIGISENKFLSKMASDMKKPLGITELWPSDVPEKLWPLPVGSMYGVGGQTAAKLADIGIRTIGNLASCTTDILTRKFGKYGAVLHDLSNGTDRSPVTPHQKDEAKSIGRSTTLPEDITGIERAAKVLMELSEEVGSDARRHGKKGTTVQITLKYADFQTITRQKSIPATFLTREIYKAGVELLKKNWSGRPVRLIGISVSGFDGLENGQLSFFDSEISGGSKKEEKLEETVDKIRGKFGKETVKRAALVEPSLKDGKSPM